MIYAKILANLVRKQQPKSNNKNSGHVKQIYTRATKNTHTHQLLSLAQI